MKLSRTTIACALLGLCLPLIAFSQPKKEEVWYRADTAHFTFFSTVKEDTTRSLANKLETLSAVIATLDPQRRSISPKPFVVYLFKNEKSFEPYYFIVDGKKRTMAWFSLQRLEARYVAVDAGKWDNASEGIYNAYSFDVIDNRFASMPPWLRWGLSEYYGTFKVDRKRISIGLPHSGNIEIMRVQSTFPFEQILATKHNDPILSEQVLGTRFRAQAWAAIHYLIHGGNRPGQIDNYIAALQQGRPESEAFAGAFEATPQKIGAEIRAYTQGSRFGYSYLEAQSVEVDTEFTWTVVPWDEMLCRLGDLMLYIDGGRPEVAASYYQAALTRNPKQGEAYAGFGAIQQKANLHAQSVEPLATAIEFSPNSYRAHLLYANGLRRSHEVESKWWEELSEKSVENLSAARTSYRRCTELEPEHVECWSGLGRTYFWDRDPSEGIAALQQALALAPARGHTAFNLMELYSTVGRAEEVEELLTAYTSILDPNQLADARRALERARENARRAGSGA